MSHADNTGLFHKREHVQYKVCIQLKKLHLGMISVINFKMLAIQTDNVRNKPPNYQAKKNVAYCLITKSQQPLSFDILLSKETAKPSRNQ